MKVLWLVPPSPFEGKIPNIAQYRFFKYGNCDSIIYPYLSAMGCTQLKNAGFEVKMLDCPTEGKSFSLRDLEGIDIVVMELRTPIKDYIYEWADKIRRENVKVILFGDHATAFQEEAKHHCDTIICGGDFDVEVTRACETWRSGVQPATYGFPWNSLLDNLDSLPFCDRELVNWRNYHEAWRHRDTFLWTMSGRGCSYNCTFCAWTKVFWHNKLRMRTPDNVVDEYEMLYKKYGECEILDDVDLFPQDWGVVFARRLLERGFGGEKILWAVQTHPNEIRSQGAWKWMRDSGLRTVKLGIESLNDYTLQRIQKKTNLKQIEKAFEILKKAKIMVHANLMVGFPWESREDAYNTIKMIKKLDPNQAQFSLLIPYLWTPLYAEALENDWLIKGVEMDARKPMLKMQGLEPADVVDLYKKHWSEFYLNWKYITKHVLNSMHSLKDLKQLYRGYKSVKYGHMRSMDVES